MLLFAIAGTLEHTNVSGVMAHYFSNICGTSMTSLVPFILSITAVGSAFVDNVIFVAAFCPVIEELSLNIHDLPLWWALLFGACFGGNITMIGSTANIVALGMLEKRSHSHVTFMQWLKVGLLSALLATTIAWAALLLLAPLMPDRYAHVPFKKLVETRIFKDKNVIIDGELIILPAKLPKKDGYKAYTMVQDIKNTTKKILVYVPADYEGKAEIGKDAAFSGKLTSQKDSPFTATLILDKAPTHNKH
jgi:hypothetical protein